MNVEILLETLQELHSGEAIYPISKFLDETVTSLQSLSNNPQDQNAQQALSSALSALMEHLQDRVHDLDPRSLVRIEEIGASKFYTLEMAAKIREAITENAMSPAVALEAADSIRQDRSNFVSQMGQTIDGLKMLRFHSESLKTGEAEIGFEIPRDIFGNDLSGLISEMRVVKFVSDTASLLTVGQRSKIELSQLSTSDPLLIFGMAPATIVMVGGFVTWALNTWKQAEEIRALRRSASENPLLGDVEELLGKKVDELVQKRIEEKAKEITAATKKTSNEEIVAMTKRSLRMMLERVERGYSIHIRLPELQQESSEEEEGQEMLVSDELYELRKGLQFPEVTGKPILELSKPKSGDDTLEDD